MGRKGKSKATVSRKQKEKMRQRRLEAVASMGLAPLNEEKPLAQRLASPSSTSEKKSLNALSSASSQGSLSIPHRDMAPTSDSLPRVCTPSRVPSPKQGVAGQTKLVEETSFDVTSIITVSKQKMHRIKHESKQESKQESYTIIDNETNRLFDTETGNGYIAVGEMTDDREIVSSNPTASEHNQKVKNTKRRVRCIHCQKSDTEN